MGNADDADDADDANEVGNAGDAGDVDDANEVGDKEDVSHEEEMESAIYAKDVEEMKSIKETQGIQRTKGMSTPMMDVNDDGSENAMVRLSDSSTKIGSHEDTEEPDWLTSAEMVQMDECTSKDPFEGESESSLRNAILVMEQKICSLNNCVAKLTDQVENLQRCRRVHASRRRPVVHQNVVLPTTTQAGGMQPNLVKTSSVPSSQVQNARNAVQIERVHTNRRMAM